MTTTPANDNRPAWFDDLLLKYEPFIRKLARRYAIQLEAEEIYQETIMHALDKWHWYHDGPDGAFSPWLEFQNLKVVSKLARERRRESNNKQVVGIVTSYGASQEDTVEIDMTMRSVSRFQGDALLMQAAGYSAHEIGDAMGRPRTSVYCAIRDGRKTLRAVSGADNDNAKRAA